MRNPTPLRQSLLHSFKNSTTSSIIANCAHSTVTVDVVLGSIVRVGGGGETVYGDDCRGGGGREEEEEEEGVEHVFRLRVGRGVGLRNVLIGVRGRGRGRGEEFDRDLVRSLPACYFTSHEVIV